LPAQGERLRTRLPGVQDVFASRRSLQAGQVFISEIDPRRQEQPIEVYPLATKQAHRAPDWVE